MALTQVTPEGIRFEVWAPRRKSVALQIGERHWELSSGPEGCFSATLADVTAGDRYFYLLDGNQSRPDPESRFQPEGVHGPSQIIDPDSYRWRDSSWKGVAKQNLVLYEFHVGTFTGPGSYLSALDRLDEILDLGATAVELLPLAQTPGRWNWGYDGVDLFAPNHNYGTPDDLRRFVDTCHDRGLAVILDVVYNHLGPEGNYLAEFAPYFSRKHKTPWGPALNFDGRHSRSVRDFVIRNALYWLREFHIDGLRLDAIRLMQDESEVSIITEIAAAIENFRGPCGYPIHLIAEANVHDPTLLEPRPEGSGYDLIWNDEIPHALFSTTLEQHQISTRRYEGASDLSQALEAGFVFQRHGNGRDIVRAHAPPRADLSSMLQGLQTHDQIGNHPEGQRLHQIASRELQQAAAALVLLHPGVPLCFMGEEFAAPSPFCFFTDFGDAHLRKAVVEGRKRDYAHQNWDQFISPLDETTFQRSKLVDRSEGDPGMLNWYRALLATRRQWMEAGILRSENLEVRRNAPGTVFHLTYAGSHQVVANFGPEPVPLPETGNPILHSRSFANGDENPSSEPWELPPNSAAVLLDSTS